MAQQTYPIPKSNPNAHMSITFLLLWLVNGLVIALANFLMPRDIVLATISISHIAALVLSSGILAWFATVTLPLFTEIEIRKKMILTPLHWMIGYFIINTCAVWIIARFSDTIGLGVSSWFFVLVLAALLDVVQGMTMMAYGEMNKKKKS